MGKYVIRRQRCLVSIDEFWHMANKNPNNPQLFKVDGSYLGDINGMDVNGLTYIESITKMIKPIDIGNMYVYVNAEITYK